MRCRSREGLDPTWPRRDSIVALSTGGPGKIAALAVR
jgi:hypothetical protein